jgi:long-chain fatty acid transport protein
MRYNNWWLAAILVTALASTAVRAQGLLAPGSGAPHRAMGGASVAAPLDANGANYWNPAAISGLSHSEVAIGGEAAYSDIHLGSSVPFTGASGRTRSNSGVSLLSGVGIVNHVEDSRLTVGGGLFTLAGASVNYEGTPNNPVLAPTGPGGRVVLGPQFSSLAIFMAAANIAYRVTDRLSVGFGPMVGTSLISVDPAFFATPDDANGDGLFTFPPGTHARPFWGGGARAGIYFQATDNIALGVSYASPLWLETWRFQSKNEVGAPRELAIKASFPAILSLGIAYKGIDKLVLASDVRYMEYANTSLFGDLLDWQNIWVVALGAQYQLSDRLSVQAGYIYNQNPVPAVRTLFNTQVPGIIQHTVSAGISFQMNENVSMSLGYVHGFKNEISGPIIEDAAAAVTLDAELDSLVFGLRIEYGAEKKKACLSCDDGTPCAGETMLYDSGAVPANQPHSAPVAPGNLSTGLPVPQQEGRTIPNPDVLYPSSHFGSLNGRE